MLPYIVGAIVVGAIIGAASAFRNSASEYDNGLFSLLIEGVACLLILIAVCVVFLVIAAGVYWVICGGVPMLVQGIHGNRQLHFAGKVVNSETSDWPNDRLVLVFLGGEEIARAISDTGEFERAGFGIHDGYFDLEVPNTYGLGDEHLRPLGFEPEYTPWWTYCEIEEGGYQEFPIPDKNIVYEVRVVPGDISSLPSSMLEEGSIYLTEAGQMAVRLNPTVQGGEVGQVLVQALRTRSAIEELEINRITLPLNNCGGSSTLEQDYTQSQTFVHEYSLGVSGSIGPEISLPGLPVSLISRLEAEYGFTQGEITSRSISYHLRADPGTSQVYIITWKEVWERGEADILVNDELVTVDFEVRTDLIYQVDSEERSCP